MMLGLHPPSVLLLVASQEAAVDTGLADALRHQPLCTLPRGMFDDTEVAALSLGMNPPAPLQSPPRPPMPCTLHQLRFRPPC